MKTLVTVLICIAFCLGFVAAHWNHRHVVTELNMICQERITKATRERGQCEDELAMCYQGREALVSACNLQRKRGK